MISRRPHRGKRKFRLHPIAAHATMIRQTMETPMDQAPAVSRNIAEFRRIAHEHAAHERFIGGAYTDGVNACFIGCYAGEDDPLHIRNRFGLPVALTRLCEIIFERLPSNAARNVFGPAVGDAIAVDGKDLSLIVPRFLHDMPGRLPEAELPHIANVRDLWGRVIAGESIDAADAARAAYAAAFAARAAEIDHQRVTLLRLLSEAPVLQVVA